MGRRVQKIDYYTDALSFSGAHIDQIETILGTDLSWQRRRLRNAYNEHDGRKEQVGTFQVGVEQVTSGKMANALAALSDKHQAEFLRRYSALLLIDNPKAVSLREFEVLLIRYLKKHLGPGRGWLFNRESEHIHAYLPLTVKYHAGGRDETPYVEMKCVYHSFKSGRDTLAFGRTEKTFHWSGSEVRGNTISECLANENLIVNSDRLVARHDAELALWRKYCADQNEMYLVTGKAVESSGWRDEGSVVNGAQFVVDHEVVEPDMQYVNTHSTVLDSERQIPTRAFVYCFGLAFHECYWVHVTAMTKFVYDGNLADKLVLPAHHSQLVDVLTKDLGRLESAGDVIEGKNKGAPVLCMGAPGLGKTMLAEVTSHKLQRPLYKINAGYLLGNEDKRVTHLEEALSEMFKRCDRQKLIPLIDEADVMIAQRDPANLTQAAVVAAFLRTLEFFNGLLFLTSNRDYEMIDDAIMSRMIAIIRFERPDTEARDKIWRMQAEAQGLPMHDGLYKALEAVECSGRDINRLVGLAKRYYNSGVPVDYTLFQRIGLYKGVVVPVQSGRVRSGKDQMK